MKIPLPLDSLELRFWPFTRTLGQGRRFRLTSRAPRPPTSNPLLKLRRDALSRRRQWSDDA